jgi:AcrR family transcriptional regulator
MPKTAVSNIARRRELARQSGEAEYRQKRAEITKAAGEIFRQKGFKGTSVTDLAAAVDMDRASLYYYIGSKEELFQEIVRDAVAGNIAMIEAIAIEERPADAKIRALIVGLMQSYAEHYPYLYVYVQEDMARIADKRTPWAKQMQALSARFDAAALRIIEQGVAEGSLAAHGASSQLIAFAIVGMCNWSHRWFRPEGKVSAEQIGKYFADIVLQGLCKPA